ncbi:hypothetical protein EV356DRAFT_445682 [Viridothelium virens]|uniref:CAP-Gly domain-containing protein n=1 Tax=Viridothelium virens TaxID=1048519 RepID=A0A6A6HB50_VIRVR|nr:hypothetical protein EV356DRAFT_445682 [Viridothelium virens]
MSSPDGGFEVGDTVDVPGGMWGVVKFIGNVKGKAGVFAGVELDREFASRGKNDGDVEGVRYFTTTVPGSGIFLPTKRASKRASVAMSVDSFPPTPTTPSFAKLDHSVRDDTDVYTPPTPAMTKFSQTVGPGARAPSPQLKLKSRPSLPRPESPFRKQPNLQPTPSRTGSIGPRGGIGTPRFTPSPAPPRTSNALGRSVGPPRPYSRNNGSRLGHRDTIEEDGETTPVGLARGPSRSSGQEDEAQRLRKKLEDRDRQLKDQAASLAEMESSLAELQSLLPTGQPSPTRSRVGASGFEDADAAQLRSLLREKNDKISMLTAEFDAHRADFRSTIDTLEMASTETERVYEKRVEDLMQEIRDLQEGRDDVESVAQQLKQLEELVQELEEGLEDARRGEAEARGEVEFLRGEVERGRSELRREREKAAAAIKGAGAAMDGPLSPGGSREVEQRDDEIRGLKAIIHSLSSGPDFGSPRMDTNKTPTKTNGVGHGSDEVQATLERLEREKEELRGLIDRKTFREEELEREVERLRIESQRNSLVSDKTLQEKRSSGRDSRGTIVNWREATQAQRRSSGPPLEPTPEAESQTSTDNGSLWCEFCETGGSHDILSCPKMPSSAIAEKGDAVTPKAPDILPAPVREEAKEPEGNADEWCALCEQDGHNATNCTMPSF